MAKKEIYFLSDSSERITFEVKGQQIKVVTVEENAKPQRGDNQTVSYMGLRPQLRSAWLHQTKHGQQVRRTLRNEFLEQLRDQ
jgi:hypothetical protein